MNPSMTFRHAFAHALPNSLVATVISVLVTVLIYLAGIHVWGADASQAIVARVADAGALGTTPSARRAAMLGSARPTRWALVDLGPRVCAPPPAGDISLCPPQTARTDLGAIVHVIKWIDASKPRLIVVDVMAVRSVAEANALDALLADVSAPVLMALPNESESQLEGQLASVFASGDEAKLASRTGKVRYFYPLIQPDEPVSRILMPAVSMAGTEGGLLAPTLSYAAATLLGLDPKCRVNGSESSRCLTDYAQTPRVFSFARVPSAGSATWDGSIRASTNGHLFLYVAAPRPGEGHAQVPELEKSVVIIGNTNTRLSARDYFWTAIGEVSGVEVQLNDIRQFTLAEPSPLPGLVGVLIADLPFLLIGFVAALLVRALSRRFPLAEDGSPFSRRLRRWRRTFGVMIAITLLSVAAFAASQYLFPPRGAAPDFFTPLISIMLGNVLEAAFQVTTWIEQRFRPEAEPGEAAS